jgi:hypothetical protein
MEIIVRTLGEVRNSRVEILIKGDGQGAAEADTSQSGDGTLSADQAKLDAYRRKADEYDRDRKTERERADREARRAKEHEARIIDLNDRYQRDLTGLRERLNKNLETAEELRETAFDRHTELIRIAALVRTPELVAGLADEDPAAMTRARLIDVVAEVQKATFQYRNATQHPA